MMRITCRVCAGSGFLDAGATARPCGDCDGQGVLYSIVLNELDAAVLHQLFRACWNAWPMNFPDGNFRRLAEKIGVDLAEVDADEPINWKAETP